jgi:hypothetical protein
LSDFLSWRWEFENFISIIFLKRWVICNDPDRQRFFCCCWLEKKISDVIASCAGRKQLWRQLGGGVSRCSNLVTESESRATVGAGEERGGTGGREPGGGSCRVELAGGRAVFSRD